MRIDIEKATNLLLKENYLSKAEYEMAINYIKTSNSSSNQQYELPLWVYYFIWDLDNFIVRLIDKRSEEIKKI